MVEAEVSFRGSCFVSCVLPHVFGLFLVVALGSVCPLSSCVVMAGSVRHVGFGGSEGVTYVGSFFLLVMASWLLGLSWPLDLLFGLVASLGFIGSYPFMRVSYASLLWCFVGLLEMGCCSSVVEWMVLCWGVVGDFGLSNVSLLSLIEGALSPMEVEIRWEGVVQFLFAARELLQRSTCLLSCFIDITISPIEVERRVEGDF
ncbi:hypothetical protein SUGI_0554040 [Cryptomeria japonica]|nr:hypothetical protein SUGI_0554040 [Cryptomeria japonica]